MTTRQRFVSPGFTLVEVLVVVGVIILLVAVLVPSIETAMERAQLTKCASNIRQLGAGVMSYAQANTGSLPPVSSNSGDRLNNRYAPRWFVQDEAGTPNPNDVRVWNLGFLWYGNERNRAFQDGPYIRESKVYFCPSVTHPDYVADTYGSGAANSSFPVLKYPGGDSNKGDKTLAVRLPYYFNPVMKHPVNDLAPAASRVSELGSYSMLALDTVEIAPDVTASETDRVVFQTFGHFSAGPSWNVLGGDQSVREVKDKREGPSNSTIAADAKAANLESDATQQRVKLQQVYGRLSGDPKLWP